MIRSLRSSTSVQLGRCVAERVRFPHCLFRAPPLHDSTNPVQRQSVPFCLSIRVSVGSGLHCHWHLKHKLGCPDHPVESVVNKPKSLIDLLERATWSQKEKMLCMLFESELTEGNGTIKEVELQKWARPLFASLLIVNGDHECPLGTSSAHHVATLAGLKTCRKEYTTTGENCKMAPAPFLRP